MKPPTPPRVSNIQEYWRDPPPEPSARLTFWLAKINNGWKENRRIGSMGYYCAAEWYGVYIWEYLHVIYPAVTGKKLPL